MPHKGHSSNARWRERYDRPTDQLEEWQAHQRVRRFPPKVILWLPVLVSLLVQVPAVFLRLVPGSVSGPPSLTLVGQISVAGLALALLGPLALIGARRFPGPVVAITAAAGSADLLLFRASDHPPYLALAFAIVSAIVRGGRAWAWISVASAWVITLVLALLLAIPVFPPRIAGITLGILILLGVGEGIRTRREQFAEISRRLAERKQSEVQAERVRIARELHDVLAHSLSQINVQAGVGLHLMENQPDKAKEALANIKVTSKTALDEVRSVLGILRAEGGADPSAPLVPEPDLSRLDGLAAFIASQGVAVDVRNSIVTKPPAAIQLALYRIAQESLTNVVRHARATSVTVVASEHDGEYLLEITDNGSGVSNVRTDSGGRGLLGMHERADLLGGTLTAATRPSGGFRVSARIPTTRIPTTRTTAPRTGVPR